MYFYNWKALNTGEAKQTHFPITGVNLCITDEGMPMATDSEFFVHDVTIQVVTTEDGKDLYEVGQKVVLQPVSGKSKRLRIATISLEKDLRYIGTDDAMLEGYGIPYNLHMDWISQYDETLWFDLQNTNLFTDEVWERMIARPAELYKCWRFTFE